MAKQGIVGLMRTLAIEAGKHSIRVNTGHPTTVWTPLIDNEHVWKIFAPHRANPQESDFAVTFQAMHLLPVPGIESDDVARAVVYLASEESRYVTGTTMVIDAGYSTRA